MQNGQFTSEEAESSNKGEFIDFKRKFSSERVTHSVTGVNYFLYFGSSLEYTYSFVHNFSSNLTFNLTFYLINF